jgi:four helix bundle protein
MTQSIVQQKSFDFAVKIIFLYKRLVEEKEFIISKQLLRSGTSIGAYIEEGLHGQSKADFIAKLSISLKEAFETRYWLKLLVAGNLTETKIETYMKDADEIINILTKIIKTTRNK